MTSSLFSVLTALNDARWRPLWWLVLAAMATVISWLAFTPHPPQAADLGWDKANHCAAFAVLAVIGLQGARGQARYWAVPLGLLAYGIFIELVQAYIPGRDSDWHDVVADMAGAVIGMALHMIVMRGLSALRRAHAG